MRIIFAGTPIFAKEILAEIHKQHEILIVYCQSDKPQGRGMKLSKPASKEYAIKHNLKVAQPDKFTKEEIVKLQQLQADIMVVVAYGKILPKNILTIPKYGCLNIHTSLLPRWRGSAPIQRAILAGDKQTGVCIMQMDEGLDTGDIVDCKVCNINADDNASMLHDKLIIIAKELIINTLNNITNIQPKRQNTEGICYANKLIKNEAWINWQQSAIKIHNQIRAFNPYPIAQTYADGNKFNKTIIKIIKAEVIIAKNSNKLISEVIAQSKLGIDVQTKDGILRITKLQLSGKKITDATSFINSYTISKFY